MIEVDNVVDVAAVLDVGDTVVLEVLVVVDNIVEVAVGEKRVKYLLEEFARIVPYSKQDLKPDAAADVGPVVELLALCRLVIHAVVSQDLPHAMYFQVEVVLADATGIEAVVAGVVTGAVVVGVDFHSLDLCFDFL